MDIELPERTAPGPDTFPVSRWGLRRWLRSFDEARPGDRVELLCTALAGLHRLEISPRRRLRILRRLQPATREMVDEFARRIGGQSLPLPGRTRAAHDACLVLLERFARGFDAVVADESRQASRPSRRRVAIAAQAALAARSEILLRCSQVYMNPPELLWRAAHAVFAAAEAVDAAGLPVRRVEGGRSRMAPVDEYKRMLVFSVANRASLRRSQIAPLYRSIGHWGGMLALEPDRPSAGDEYLITVDLGRPDPPAIRHGEDREPAPGVRILSISGIIEALAAEEATAPGEDSAIIDPGTLRASTIRKLLDDFRQAAVRSVPRHPVHENIEVEIGLRRIQSRLAVVFQEEQDASAFSPVSGSGLSLQTIGGDPPGADGYVIHPGHGPENDIAMAWEAVHRKRPVIGSFAAQDGIAPDAVRPGDRAGHWSLEDSSQNGFRLRWEGEQALCASVGELIGLHARDRHGQPRWVLGVVRWLRLPGENQLDLGAERLPGLPRAATVRAEPVNRNRRRRREEEHTEPALFLPGRRNRDRAATIMVPAHIFRTGDTVEIDVGERTLRVRLGEAYTQSPTFVWFPLTAAPRDRVQRSIDHFEDRAVWQDPSA